MGVEGTVTSVAGCARLEVFAGRLVGGLCRGFLAFDGVEAISAGHFNDTLSARAPSLTMRPQTWRSLLAARLERVCPKISDKRLQSWVHVALTWPCSVIGAGVRAADAGASQVERTQPSAHSAPRTRVFPRRHPPAARRIHLFLLFCLSAAQISTIVFSSCRLGVSRSYPPLTLLHPYRYLHNTTSTPS